jgi:prepilin-type N-terminal cleavage/methylation domain-containing protein
MSQSMKASGSRQAGFSLIELMVAMMVGSVVISMAYYMSQASARIFSEQLRRSETQMSLRSATELIRRDIGRAGYLSIRDTTEVPGCVATGPLGQVGAADTDVAPRRVFAARVELDASGRQMLFLTGNMTTTEHYFVSAGNSTSLTIQTTNEGYRRSFINPIDGVTFLPSRFAEAFFPDPATPGRGRMVSVTDLDRARIFLRDLTGASNATIPPTLQLGTPLPMNAMGAGSCMNFNSIVVAPVSIVRYSVETPGTGALERLGSTYLTGQSATGAPARPVLMRAEVDAATDAVIAGTEQIVLDGIAQPGGLTVAAVIDNGIAPAVNLVHTSTPETLLTQSGQIRSLIIQVIVESSERQEGDALNVQVVRNARRALRFEVMMPNAARNSGAF